MKKRWTAALLALVLAASLLPAPARAAASADNSAGSRLTGADREVYDYLREEIIRIAKGTRTSTEITIPELKGLRWTVKELGVDSREDVLAKLEEKLNENLDFDHVYDCLAADLPYEMFWKDNRYSWGYSLARDGSWASVKSITAQIFVARDYQGGSETRTDAARVAAANRAEANARAIVDKYRDRSDFEKLTAYREEICRLTSYNTGAAGSRASYGDPWQLIYVFDGDPDTSVVCEGYAKAFKHLCDLSEFDGDVACRTVTGTMGGNAHMWNVVRMGDGKNYLVDVTNCDSGTIGADDKLFLAGAAGSEDGRTYTVTNDRLKSVYTYDQGTADVYADGWLALSAADYVDAPLATITITPSQTEPPADRPVFTDVAEDAYYAGAVAWAVEREITNGTSETTFSPDKTCTEAEILTFLWRAAGKTDSGGEASEEDSFYAAAVAWARGTGVLPPGDFSPDTPCTRASAVDFIWRAFGEHDPDQASHFTDVPEDGPYADPVAWAVEQGVTNGVSATTFDPDATCTRAQIVTFLYRAYH